MTGRPKGFMQRASRTLAYAITGLAGLAGLLFPPQSYAGDIGAWVPTAWAILLLVGGALAAIGSAIPKYRWEWLAMYPAAAGAALYASASLSIAITGSEGNWTRALILVGVAFMFIAQSSQLGREDREARKIRAAELAVMGDD